MRALQIAWTLSRRPVLLREKGINMDIPSACAIDTNYMHKDGQLCEHWGFAVCFPDSWAVFVLEHSEHGGFQDPFPSYSRCSAAARTGIKNLPGCTKTICFTAAGLHLYQTLSTQRWYLPCSFGVRCKKWAKHCDLHGFLSPPYKILILTVFCLTLHAKHILNKGVFFH